VNLQHMLHGKQEHHATLCYAANGRAHTNTLLLCGLLRTGYCPPRHNICAVQAAPQEAVTSYPAPEQETRPAKPKFPPRKEPANCWWCFAVGHAEKMRHGEGAAKSRKHGTLRIVVSCQHPDSTLHPACVTCACGVNVLGQTTTIKLTVFVAPQGTELNRAHMPSVGHGTLTSPWCTPALSSPSVYQGARANA